jgi:glycine/D-amino acid oxidase-like deaminating enzyme
MTNLYCETAIRAPEAQPLERDRRAEVIVVGGGFTGLSTALHLAERGADVVLLEAEQPGWGASGRNGGQVNPGLKHDPDEVERHFGAVAGARMVAFAGAAPQFVFDLIERLNLDCEATRGGTLRAAVHATHVPALRVTAAQWQRRGTHLELLEGEALERVTGMRRYPAGLFDRRGGALNPLSFARGLARAATAAGASIHGGTRALALNRSDRDWQVHGPGATVTAPRVVLATNGYTDGLWPGLARSIVPVFGAIVATEPLPDSLRGAILPGRTVVYESGAITVYYRVDAQGRLIIGGRGPMREIRSASEIPHIVDYARTLWPGLAAVRFTHAWGGRLGFTADGYPHVHEPAEGILIGCGYNGRGVALATAMGRELAMHSLDPQFTMALPITNLKTMPLHGLWPWAVRGAILRGRVLDWAGW